MLFFKKEFIVMGTWENETEINTIIEMELGLSKRKTHVEQWNTRTSEDSLV